MLKVKQIQLTKRDISKTISNNLGFSLLFSEVISNDIISLLKELVVNDSVKILNFGTFNVLKKKERIGRNPRNKKIYKIKARKVISFHASTSMINKVNIF